MLILSVIKYEQNYLECTASGLSQSKVFHSCFHGLIIRPVDDLVIISASWQAGFGFKINYFLSLDKTLT